MDICNIAPLGLPCVYGDGKRTISCSVHHLYCAGRELLKEFPFIGAEFADYHCPDFELQSGDT